MLQTKLLSNNISYSRFFFIIFRKLLIKCRVSKPVQEIIYYFLYYFIPKKYAMIKKLKLFQDFFLKFGKSLITY